MLRQEGQEKRALLLIKRVDGLRRVFALPLALCSPSPLLTLSRALLRLVSQLRQARERVRMQERVSARMRERARRLLLLLIII